MRCKRCGRFGARQDSGLCFHCEVAVLLKVDTDHRELIGEDRKPLKSWIPESQIKDKEVGE